MRLLTFNTLFRGDVRLRLRALGARLERSDYDVVCLQEVMVRHGAGLLRRAAPSFTHHVHTGSVLLKGGLVILSRLPITGYRFLRYPLTRPARREYVMRKGAQFATIGDHVIVNTHLTANHDDDWSPANRYTRAQRVELDHLATRLTTIDPALPVVVAGDLNLPRDSSALAGFLAATGLVHGGDTKPTYRPTARFPAPPALDHVLVRPSTAVRTRLVFQDEVVLADGREAYLSDHYGVEADLEPARRRDRAA